MARVNVREGKRIPQVLVSYWVVFFMVSISSSAIGENSMEERVNAFLDQYYQSYGEGRYENLYELYDGNSKIAFELDFGLFYPTDKSEYTLDEYFSSDWNSEDYELLSVKAEDREIELKGEEISAVIKIKEKYSSGGKKGKASGEDVFVLKLQDERLLIQSQLSKRDY